jgi:dienelactone hydrolase
MKVIISCHGSPPFDVAEHHIRTWKWYGEQHGCIIICPDLVGTDGIIGDGPVYSMIDCERRILSILSTLSYRYNLDRSNIMLTGFSGGGFPVYWVGLRHPELFSVLVAQNCNFNKGNTDGWYPAEAAKKTPVIIYYGETDPLTIQIQSKAGIDYLRSRGFKVETKVIRGERTGHDRHPEIAMAFFKKHWKEPRSTYTESIGPVVAVKPRPKETPVRQGPYIRRGPPPPLP